MLDLITNINHSVNGFVWGIPMLVLLVGTGILMSFRTGFFQISHFGHWLKNTIGAVFTDKNVTAHTADKDKSISPFQSLCTALAATIGTGNIAGVAAAIASGGPGAVFWMWVVALFGMMTHFSETVLGLFYRKKNEAGEWTGGAMYYLEYGLGSRKGMKTAGKILAVMFAVFCAVATFGIGNMSQVNTIAVNMQKVFHISPVVTGLVLMTAAALVIIGGLKRIASVTEMIVPFMAIGYIVGSLVIVICNISTLPAVFAAIWKGAWGMQAVGGGIVGYGVKAAVTWGMKRGVFSNEAGLGSSVMVHASSNVKEPVKQGMWGIFEVFSDTIIVCSLTALVILSSGVVDLNTGAMRTGAESTALVAEAFSTVFGGFGSVFIAISILLFAFSTVLGWSQYGLRSFEYLFGSGISMLYKITFIVVIFFGSTMNLELAWELSDTFNGLMAIPNLIGLLFCSSTVIKILKNYIDRTLLHKQIKPMYSAYEDIQKMQEEDDTAD